jgi:hypothetical protein
MFAQMLYVTIWRAMKPSFPNCLAAGSETSEAAAASGPVQTAEEQLTKLCALKPRERD